MPDIAKKFYPEIQGIRAISIIAVILFHLSARTLPGGYIGVDMFFVISGFLITSMIVGEITHGSFSLARFYKNRVVRLLPNLFLMIIASVIISYLILSPYHFFQYAKSLQFSAIYVTNMVFARQQGYFDMSREAKPLLHTWSLSIEEQFYLVFPLLLILLYKLKAHRILVLILIALASLWVRFNYIQQHLPIEGFFSFAGRVWEFVVGALIALMPVTLKQRLSGNEILASGGLLLVAASLLLLDESVPYSGLWLLVPCLATAAIICSGQGTFAGSWLGSKSLVFIGGMSYSLYLWHWPLTVWFRNVDYGLSHLNQSILLLAATIIFSYVAWKYVEEPFRRNREKFSGRRVGLFTLGFAIFCISIGSYIYAESGMEYRFPNWVAVKHNLEQFDFKAATGTQVSFPESCSIGDDPQTILRQCSFGDKRSSSRFLLIGDSHSFAWYPAFQAAAEARHVQGVQVTLPGCPPLFGVRSYDGAKDVCAEDFDRRIGSLLAAQKFDKIFLVAHWSMYSEGEPGNQPDHFISDALESSHDADSSKKVLTRHLQETLQRMIAAGSEVVIVHSVPILPKTVQDLPVDFSQPLTKIVQQNQFMHDFVQHWQGSHLSTVDPTGIFCNAQTCQTRIRDNVLYTDNNHISQAGAALLIKLLEVAL